MLLKKRDEIVWAWVKPHPGDDLFEDRELDITSQMEISEANALWLVELALAGRIR